MTTRLRRVEWKVLDIPILLNHKQILTLQLNRRNLKLEIEYIQDYILVQCHSDNIHLQDKLTIGFLSAPGGELSVKFSARRAFDRDITIQEQDQVSISLSSPYNADWLDRKEILTDGVIWSYLIKQYLLRSNKIYKTPVKKIRLGGVNGFIEEQLKDLSPVLKLFLEQPGGTPDKINLDDFPNFIIELFKDFTDGTVFLKHYSNGLDLIDYANLYTLGAFLQVDQLMDYCVYKLFPLVNKSNAFQVYCWCTYFVYEIYEQEEQTGEYVLDSNGERKKILIEDGGPERSKRLKLKWVKNYCFELFYKYDLWDEILTCHFDRLSPDDQYELLTKRKHIILDI